MTPRKWATWQDRFWSKVDKTETCWLWTASLGDGYGRFRNDGLQDMAHRVAYRLLVGPIPDGLTVDHLCRTRRCVNPAHMELVTSVENVMRGESPHARNARKTHCKHGHPFHGDNLVVLKSPLGARGCRACNREKASRHRERVAA